MPKEPRQLMINLMYIVLTALLALNVRYIGETMPLVAE